MKRNRLTRRKPGKRVGKIQELFLISVLILAAGCFLWNRCSRIIGNHSGIEDYGATALPDSVIAKNEIERYAKKHGIRILSWDRQGISGAFGKHSRSEIMFVIQYHQSCVIINTKIAVLN